MQKLKAESTRFNDLKNVQNPLNLGTRKLTDNYRNFTFIRTYFIVVLQQHSSSNTLQQHSSSKTTGVGEAPNTHYLIFLTTSPILYLEQQQKERVLLFKFRGFIEQRKE